MASTEGYGKDKQRRHTNEEPKKILIAHSIEINPCGLSFQHMGGSLQRLVVLE